MIPKETVEQALRSRRYKVLNQTKKKIAFQLGARLPLYVNLTSQNGTTSLVLHPEEGFFDVARNIDGVIAGDSYYHSSNMTLFPKRMHGGQAAIGYGRGFSFESEAALEQFLDVLEGIQLRPVVTDKLAAENTTTRPGYDVDVNATRRVGHGAYRDALVSYWQGCAVTGMACEKLLRASHIIPWADSGSVEKTDPFNGLLLTPNLDAAFDKGFISFADDGAILISSKLSAQDAAFLGIHPSQKLRKVAPQHLAYLSLHRTELFLN